MLEKSSTVSIKRKKNSSLNIPGVGNVISKIPPQAVDVEEAVLGALMLEKHAIGLVVDILTPDCFYKDAHELVYKAIQTLFHKSEPIDIITVTHALKNSGQLELVGGPYFVTQLTNRVASAANIEYHARIILQKYILRELIKFSSDTITEAYEDTTDVLNLLDTAEKNLFSIAEGNIRRGYQNMPALIGMAIKEIEKAAEEESGVTGIPSGFTELDRITAGWHKTDNIVIAARPGMGKTALVLTLARNAAVKFKKPVAFFSLEMSAVQLTNRLIAAETEIASDKLRRGRLERHEWEQLNSKIGPITNAPLYIDDTPSLSIFELRAKARRLVAERKVELILIDYLQLMVGNTDNRNSNREQEISMISRSIKSIAKELNVPIITLSQLSRDVEKRGGSKKPQLSDLRESGAIEQDADMVLFIYRPEYYGYDEDAEQHSTSGLAQIIIAKNRNGALAEVSLKFIGHLTKFTEMDGDPFVDDNSFGIIEQFNPSDRITRNSRMNDMSDDENETKPF